MIAGMYIGGNIPTPTVLIPAQTSIGAALMDNDIFFDRINNIDVTQTFHTPVLANVIVAARSIKDKYGVNLRFYLENNPPLDNRKFSLIITAKSDVSSELEKITDGIDIRSVVGKDNSYVITADTSIYYLSMIAFIADVTSLDMSEKLNLTGLASCRVEWDGVNDILAENTTLHPVIKTNGKLQYVSVYLDDKKVNGGEILSGGSYRWEVNSGKKGLHKLSFKINDSEGYGISGQNQGDTRVCVPTVVFETIDEKERKQIGLPATKCEVEWDGISSEYSENTPFTVKGKITSSEVGKGYITVYMDGKTVEGGKIVGEGFEWDINSQSKGDHVIQLKVNDWERYKISGQDESLSQFCGEELNFTTR